MNALDLALKKVKLRKVSGTKGGEWQGSCPACGGDDRFHVWPNQNEGKGSYWCRSCGKAGDNIQFLRDFEGYTFKEACAHLNINLPDMPAHHSPSTPQRQKPEFTPNQYTPPGDLWQEKAEKFITWAQGHLAKNSDVLNWLDDRGIGDNTAANFRLGWNPGEDGKDIYRYRKAWGLPEILKDDSKPKALWIPRGLVIPHITDGIIHRIRIRRPDGDPRYYVIPGSSAATMIIERARLAFVVVESELDAIAVAAQNNLAGAVALGSVSAKPDAETYAILQGALAILNALDYGDIGGGAKAAQRAMEWWKEQFDRCERWPVPKGKDPGEAYRLGIDLEQWIKVGLPPALMIGEERMERSLTGRHTGHDENDVYTVPGPSPKHDLLPLVQELYDLLRKNPEVKIISTPSRFTVLRNGKFVGGRINELIFRVPEVTEYIMNHPAEEIDGVNYLYG